MFKINSIKAAEIQTQKEIQNIPFKLDAIFSALPLDARAQFYEKKAAIKLALEQGDTLAAAKIIQDTVVPPELQDVKDSLLQFFGGA